MCLVWAIEIQVSLLLSKRKYSIRRVTRCSQIYIICIYPKKFYTKETTEKKKKINKFENIKFYKNYLYQQVKFITF